jgi:hypothetical protein
VVADNVASLAEGATRIVGASPHQLSLWSENARLAARAASWRTRAIIIHAALGIP